MSCEAHQRRRQHAAHRRSHVATALDSCSRNWHNNSWCWRYSEISFVRGAAPQLIDLRVAIKRTISGSDINAVSAVRTSTCVPVLLNGIKVTIVVCVHSVSQPDLFLVVEAIGLLGFCFCPPERRKQYARQNGDYGDHNQKFDQREGAASNPTVHFHI